MGVRIADLLKIDPLTRVRVRAGAAALDNEVRWVHLWPETQPWIHGGELLLTTAYSWPGVPNEQRRIIGELHRTNVAGVLFATGRFFPPIPKAVLRASQRMRLPILEARFEIVFAELTELVNQEIIRQQYTEIERSEWIHKKLTSVALEATELRDICVALAELIKKPVLIVDAAFAPLASGYSPGETDPLAQAGLLVASERAKLARAREPVRVTDRDGREWIVCPIRLASDTVGYVQVSLEGAQPTNLDLRASEHGALVAALHILRQQSVASVEARVQNSFVQALIHGEFGPATGLEERARLVGFDPQGRYVVGLLALLGKGGRKRTLGGPAEFHLRERLDQALRQALREQGHPTFLGYLMNFIVMLLPAPETRTDLVSAVQLLWKRVRAREPRIPAALTMGNAHATAGGIAYSFDEADSTLTASTGDGVFWYDDLRLTKLLRGVSDSKSLEGFYRSTVGRLQEDRRADALKQTLRSLVRSGFNQRAAARALNLHWNTMRYRVARMEELFGRPLADPTLRLELQLALEIESLMGVHRTRVPRDNEKTIAGG